VKKKYCSEIQRGENRTANLEEFSKEGYGSKRVVFPTMMTVKYIGKAIP
jgi:hypothetical protein